MAGYAALKASAAATSWLRSRNGHGPARRASSSQIRVNLLPSASLSRGVLEQVVHWHPPARHGRFRVRDVAAPVDRRSIGALGAVASDDILAEQVHVPDDERAGRKIVG